MDKQTIESAGRQAILERMLGEGKFQQEDVAGNWLQAALAPWEAAKAVIDPDSMAASLLNALGVEMPAGDEVARSNGEPHIPASSVNRFDPEGSGYDYKTARESGLGPDEEGHWPSRDPRTGLLLKGRKHKTWDLLVDGERKAGYKIYKGRDGRYYSRKLSNSK